MRREKDPERPNSVLTAKLLILAATSAALWYFRGIVKHGRWRTLILPGFPGCMEHLRVEIQALSHYQAVVILEHLEKLVET